MRNPSTAKTIAPQKSKMVASYESVSGYYVEIYHCVSTDAIDDLRKYAALNGYEFREHDNGDYVSVKMPPLK